MTGQKRIVFIDYIRVAACFLVMLVLLSTACSRRDEYDVYLVMNARGGTSIRSWLKGAPQENYGRASDDPQNWGKQIPSFYDEAVRRAKEGMKYGPLKAIVWHQGFGPALQSDVAAVYIIVEGSEVYCLDCA